MTDSDNPRRVLLKLSGEAFGGGKVGIDTQVIRRIAEEIVPAVQQGVQVAIVVGGGNYTEYQYLQTYAKSQNPARVVLYGSTDILPAKQVREE